MRREVRNNYNIGQNRGRSGSGAFFRSFSSSTGMIIQKTRMPELSRSFQRPGDEPGQTRRLSMSESQVFDEERITAELKARRILKRLLMLQKEGIQTILKASEASKAFGFVDFLFSEADVDNWIKDPQSAREEIKRIRAEILKENDAIKSLKAMIEKEAEMTMVGAEVLAECHVGEGIGSVCNLCLTEEEKARMSDDSDVKPISGFKADDQNFTCVRCGNRL
jgi:hypothetical protein